MASIRVNCQIYVTSVMINTFITFLFKQSTLPAVIFSFVAKACRLGMRAYYIRMLWWQINVMAWYSCDADILFKKSTIYSKVLVLSDKRRLRELDVLQRLSSTRLHTVLY